MRKAIYLLAAVMLGATVSARPTDKDRFATAKQLYDAGRWSAAQYELGEAAGSPPVEGWPQSGRGDGITVDNISLRIEIETLYAFCAARLEQSDAGDRLNALLAKYPASPYTNEVKFRAGVFEYDNGLYAGAWELLREVDPRRLPESDIDEYRFKTGHSHFAVRDYDSARRELAKVARNSPFRPHADYYTAYMDYDLGDYGAAKQAFFDLSTHPSYHDLAPYYLLQIEFMEGNYPYITEHGDRLIARTAMPRKAELTRVMAESWFHLKDYGKALDYIARYRELGGEPGREENYLEGFSLYGEGRWREAIEPLSKATGADDRLSQNASYHLADAYLKAGDRGRAMQSFSIASAQGYDETIAEDALFNYGKLQYELGGGRFNEAVNVLDRYLDLYPDSPRVPQVREYLISAYYNSQNYEAAYNAIMQYPDPDNNIKAALQKITYFRGLEFWNAGDAGEAMRLLDISSGYRYNTKYTALAAFWQGEILYSGGDYRAAVPKYEEYLRLSPTSEPENVMARYNLGYSHFNLRAWDASLGRFDDFLDRHSAYDPYRADALNREGDIHHARREYWKAIESYDKAAAVGTEDRFYSAYQRALMLGLVDRTDRKIESLQDIIRKGEGDYVEDAMYELGRTYITSDRYTDGANTLVQFTARYPRSEYCLPALSNLGLAYLNMGDRTQSMRYYKMIVERAPWSREAQDAMANLRGLYVDANDVDGYFDYAKKAGAPTDTSEMQRDSLTFAAAERIYLSGDTDRAITAIENYIASTQKRGQYVPTAIGYLSGLYHKAGRYADAAATYRTIAETATDPAMKTRGYDGLAASVLASKDAGAILELASESGTITEMSEKSRRDVLFAAAGALRGDGKADEAIAIYEDLSADVRTVQGAESAYRVIEYLYNTGDYTAAEEAVFAFSEKGTPHSYWLGEAFLTLGDIYVKAGDTFQARATWQSIVDGYSPSGDGIVAAARERIASLR